MGLQGSEHRDDNDKLQSICAFDCYQCVYAAVRRRARSPRASSSSGTGGVLERSDVVEVVSSLERDGRPGFRDLRWGVYVVLEGRTIIPPTISSNMT